MEENPFLAESDVLGSIRELIRERRFEEAAEKAQAALKDNPFLTEAEELYNRAVEALNAEPFILEHLRVAEDHFGKLNYQEAIASARKILDLDSDHLRAQEIFEVSQQKIESEPFVREFITRGEEYFAGGDVEKARTEWQKIETIDPGNAVLFSLLARCDTIVYRKKYTPEEEETINRLTAEGQRHFDDGRYQEAINNWSRILVIDETHEDARASLTRARQALEERQREIDETLHRARVSLEGRRFDEGVALLDAQLQKVPGHPELQVLREQIVSERRERERLAEEEIPFLEPEPGPTREPAGPPAAAVAAAPPVHTALAAPAREDAETHYRHAVEHRRQGNLILAFNEVSHALELDPSHSAAQVLQMEIESALGSTESLAPVEMELEPEAILAPPPPPAPALAPPVVALPPAPRPVAAVAPPPPAMPIAAPPVVAAAAPAPRRRFLIVSASIFLVGIGLLVIFLLERDRIFGTLNAGLDRAVSEEFEAAGPLPLPSGAEGFLLQGQSLLDRKQYLDAIFYFQKVPPDSPVAKRASALIAQAQQQLLEVPAPPSATDTAPAAESRTTPPPAEAVRVINEGRAAFNAANFETASQRFSRALEIDPASSEAKAWLSRAYYNLGLLAMRESNMETAEANFRRVLTLVPDDEESRRQIAVTRRYREQPSDHSLEVYLRFQKLR